MTWRVSSTRALVDDSQYIDPQTLGNGGDAAKGKDALRRAVRPLPRRRWRHAQVPLRGPDATLGTLAVVDPWRFLHKTRFGTPGTEMVIGYDLGWQAQDGRDVLLYAQSLPTGLEQADRGAIRQRAMKGRVPATWRTGAEHLHRYPHRAGRDFHQPGFRGAPGVIPGRRHFRGRLARAR